MSVRYSPKSHIYLAKYENNYPYQGLKIAWKSLNDVQWDSVNVDQFDKLKERLNESLGSWGEIIKALFFFGILLFMGPGLIIINVGEIINQGDDFSLWDDDFGPEDPQFAGEVIWEGTADESWIVELTDIRGGIRVWVQEGKTVDVSIPRDGASFDRCDPSDCDYFNNANESIPGYEFIGEIHVYINNTYDVKFTSTGDSNETTNIIVTKEVFHEPGAFLIFLTFVGTVITCVMILIVYHTTKKMREEARWMKRNEKARKKGYRSHAENIEGTKGSFSKNNWIGPDGTESGPGVPEDWYLTYNGPAPIVEDIYDENYVVDRGNGTVPVNFYIKKWGVPEGFGNTEHEKLWSME